MTAPIPGLLEATPLHAAHYWHLQITGPDQGVTIAQVLQAAAAAKLITYGAPEIHAGQDDQITWSLKISSNGNDFTHAAPGDYIVITANDDGALTGISFYNGPDGTYSNPAFSDTFSIEGQ